MFLSVGFLSNLIFLLFAVGEVHANNSTNGTVSAEPVEPAVTSEPTAEPVEPAVTSEGNDTYAPPVFEECRELDDYDYYYCPTKRYCDWDSLSSDANAQLTDYLGYDKLSWNYGEQNPIETGWMTSLNETQQNILKAVGFDSDRHDCCSSHYGHYGWKSFTKWEMPNEKKAYELLGYDQEKWNADAWLDNFDLWWDELADEVRFGLEVYLCYSKNLWDGETLDNWSDDAFLPGTYDNSVTYSWSPTVLPTSAPILTDAPTNAPTFPPTISTSPTSSKVEEQNIDEETVGVQSAESQGYKPTMKFFYVFFVSYVLMLV